MESRRGRAHATDSSPHSPKPRTSSAVNHRASTSSSAFTSISVDTARARKPSISDEGKGQGWDAW